MRRRTLSSKFYILTILLLLFFSNSPKYLYGQELNIVGKVTDHNGHPLSSCSIILKTENNITIAYTITDEKGIFELAAPKNQANSKIFYLEVAHLGYKKYRSMLSRENIDKQWEIILELDETILDEVVIKKNIPIVAKQDTISYHVESFSKEEDRSIGDVLRRLPGIKVDPDGTIYHNDKKIENLYIHGDDLMAGRYGLATKTVRKEMIESIEVINNHQPVRVLENKFLTDKTAINLVLKNENDIKISMQGQVGGGVPGLYLAETTAILLNKRIKSLNQLGLNNSGKDYQMDLRQLGGSNFTDDLRVSAPDIPLSLGIAEPAGLGRQNYFDNNSKVINLNNLMNDRNNTQYRLNLQFFKDKIANNQRIETINYLADDTITFSEDLRSTDRPLILHANLNIQSNRTSFFVNNSLQVNMVTEENTGSALFNTNHFSQDLSAKVVDISNDFNWIPQISNRGILDFRWLVQYNTQKKNLKIQDGILPLLNHSGSQTSKSNIHQRISLPTVFSNAYFGYKLYNETFSQDYKIGWEWEQVRLKSSLSTVPDMEDVDLFYNDATWSRNRIYIDANFIKRLRKLSISLEIPIGLQQVAYKQPEFQLDSTYLHFITSPRLSAQYDIDGERKLRFNYMLSNRFSDITNLYRGYILNNLRHVSAYDSEFENRNTHLLDLRFNLEKTIRMLFSNFRVFYQFQHLENIISTTITENGQNFSLIPLRNRVDQYGIGAGVSKYFYQIGLNTSINSSFRISKSRQMTNDLLIPIELQDFQLSFSASKRLIDKIEVRYIPSVSILNNTINNRVHTHNNVNHSIVSIHNSISAFAHIHRFLQTEINADFSTYRSTGQPPMKFNLLNINNRIPLKTASNKLDIGVKVQNLFDINNYSSVYLNNNYSTSTDYGLRGRMFLVDLTFYL